MIYWVDSGVTAFVKLMTKYSSPLGEFFFHSPSLFPNLPHLTSNFELNSLDFSLFSGLLFNFYYSLYKLISPSNYIQRLTMYSNEKRFFFSSKNHSIDVFKIYNNSRKK